MIISLCCWGFASILLVAGITSMLRKKPAGIYSNIKSPEVESITDLRGYNHAVGKLLIGYSLLFIIVGFLCLFVNEKKGGLLLTICAFFGAIGIMIIYELVIIPRYSKR